MGKANQGTDAFQDAVASALRDNGTIKSLVPKFTVKVRDLDVLTSEADVKAAPERELGPPNEVKVHVTKPNSRGQRTVIIQLKEEKAKKTC